jgi:hypothetical protein
MGKRSNKTTKTTRTEAQIRADLKVALTAEHGAVEGCSNNRPKSLVTAWAAAERTNVLYRELAALSR